MTDQLVVPFDINGFQVAVHTVLVPTLNTLIDGTSALNSVNIKQKVWSMIEELQKKINHLNETTYLLQIFGGRFQEDFMEILSLRYSIITVFTFSKAQVQRINELDRILEERCNSWMMFNTLANEIKAMYSITKHVRPKKTSIFSSRKINEYFVNPTEEQISKAKLKQIEAMFTAAYRAAGVKTIGVNVS